MKLLLIEDEEPFANVLAVLLEKIARQVLVAHSLAAADQVLKLPNGVDVVVLDLNLPDSHTMDTAAEIQRIKGTGRKVVVMSGMGIDPEIVKLYGADAFCDKKDVDFPVKLLGLLKA